MPNDKGCVVLLDRQGNIIDECPYTKYMHHCLISDREGIALEKIHPDLPSAEANSWLSAAADASYGTPGRINSQYRPLDTVDTKEGFLLNRIGCRLWEIQSTNSWCWATLLPIGVWLISRFTTAAGLCFIRWQKMPCSEPGAFSSGRESTERERCPTRALILYILNIST